MGHTPDIAQGSADEHRGESGSSDGDGDGGQGQDDPINGGGDDGLGLSVPTLSRKHAAIGVIVILGILVYLRYTRSGTGNGTTKGSIEQVPDRPPQEEDEGLNIEEEPGDPLSADHQYIQESGAFDALTMEDDE